MLSNWRYLIDYKWGKTFKLLIPQTIANWCNSIFFSVFLLNPDRISFMIVNLSFIFILMIYEIISVSYAGLKNYSRSIYNAIDVYIIIAVIAVDIVTYFVENRNNT